MAPKFRYGDEVAITDPLLLPDHGIVVQILTSKRGPSRYVVDTGRYGLYTLRESDIILEDWTKTLEEVEPQEE